MTAPRRRPGVFGALLLALSQAAHAAAPMPCTDPDLPERTLALVNRLRALGALCGAMATAPAPPLQWSDAAAQAALAHAQEMAERRHMAHAGSDGQQAGERLRRAGLDWQRWAENLALGHRSIEHVMGQWTGSALHCHNLMQPDLVQVGLACAVDRHGRVYWAMSLAAPR